MPTDADGARKGDTIAEGHEAEIDRLHHWPQFPVGDESSDVDLSRVRSMSASNILTKRTKEEAVMQVVEQEWRSSARRRGGKARLT